MPFKDGVKEAAKILSSLSIHHQKRLIQEIKSKDSPTNISRIIECESRIIEVMIKLIHRGEIVLKSGNDNV